MGGILFLGGKGEEMELIVSAGAVSSFGSSVWTHQ